MTVAALALVGGLIGVVLFGDHIGGFVLGGALGALAGWVTLLGDRVQKLERRLLELRTHAPSAAQESAHARMRPSAEGSSHLPSPALGAQPPARAPMARPPAPQSGAPASAQGYGRQRASTSPPRSRAGDRAVPLDLAVDRVRTWLTTGNVPVKVGVVLSVFGVGFLVTEAINRHWMVIPIELRLVFVALFGIALLGLGWRLRDKNRTYALSIQGGGIAVLYLTTYASFAIYQLLPSAAAFLLLLAVTVAVGALAVVQDSRALAVLGVIGGFMAPVLTSNGAGNHVVLFGYYSVLNLAIVGIAWFKSWRALNVLGFLFTFVIGSLWGYTGYRPEHFTTTEPFLVLFVLMYTVIPVLFALRQTPDLRGFVDGTLLFGTPLVGFGLQVELVGDTTYGLAISALALAAFYAGLAALLLRRRETQLRVLVDALFALAAVFLTIAVPLALDTRWTSVAWSVEGAAMVWLAVRQQRKLPLATGFALQAAAGAMHFGQDYQGYHDAADRAVLNGPFLGAVLIAAAGWLSGWLADRARQTHAAERWMGPRPLGLIASVFLGWGSAWWVLAGIVELGRHAPGRLEPAVALMFVAATALVAILTAPRIDWRRLNAVGLLTLPAIVLGAALALVAKPHPFADLGWFAWPAILAVHALVLRLREAQFPAWRPVLHTVAYWVLALLLAVETAWSIDRVADGIWPVSGALAVTALLVLLTVQASGTSAWPVGAHSRTYLFGGAAVVLAALVLATFAANLTSAADPTPLPYVPLLNPLELASVFAAFVLLRWWGACAALQTPESDGAERARAAIATRGMVVTKGAVALPALFGLFLLTMIVARTVHHWAGVPFDLELLARSTQFQAALSMVWGTTALIGMLLGARRGKRIVWMCGAALMAIVVVKLFLIDLGNAGTVGRVISFLGVGVLLLVVGYFAPVPPRTRLEANAGGAGDGGGADAGTSARAGTAAGASGGAGAGARS
jgi:uncharacterized membrane protein